MSPGACYDVTTISKQVYDKLFYEHLRYFMKIIYHIFINYFEFTFNKIVKIIYGNNL